MRDKVGDGRGKAGEGGRRYGKVARRAPERRCDKARDGEREGERGDNVTVGPGLMDLSGRKVM